MSHRDLRTSIDTQGKGRHSTQTGPQITNNTHNNMVLTKNGLVYYTLQKHRRKTKSRTNQGQQKLRTYFDITEGTTGKRTETVPLDIEDQTYNRHFHSRHGDKLNITVSDNTFRLVSNNVNGLNLTNEGAHLIEEITVLKEIGASAIAMQETNTNWNKNNMYDRVKKLFTRAWNNTKLQTSNYKENTRTAYQIGGTALCVTGKYVSKVCDLGSNHMGCWSWVTIKEKKTRK